MTVHPGWAPHLSGTTSASGNANMASCNLEVAIMIDTTNRGERVPMPVLPTLDGSTLDLATLRGKKVLLFMWGSW